MHRNNNWDPENLSRAPTMSSTVFITLTDVRGNLEVYALREKYFAQGHRPMKWQSWDIISSLTL